MTYVTIKDRERLIFNYSTEDYLTLYKQSITQPIQFWSEQANLFIDWFKPWSHIQEGSFENLPVRWFLGSELNVSFNCVDRHASTNPNKIALLWEGNHPSESLKITYKQLFYSVCKMANIIKNLGVKKGDVVCIYMPMIPEAIYAMLACARIGAVHNVVFGGFSADALKTRIQDSSAKILITANFSERGTKTICFKDIVDEALIECPSVQKTLVIQRKNNPTNMIAKRDFWYHEYLNKVSDDCPPESIDSQHPLFILYTSGSTGKPKGILHTTGGYAVYAALTYYALFNHQPKTIHWCTADIGWITGHSYLVYGPLLNGATTVVFEGIPNYPDFSRIWEIIEKYQVTNFYTAPTLLRNLRYEGTSWFKSYDRSSLEILGSVGEPINPEVWLWMFKEIGEERCPIVNTWWQTETGGILLSPFPSDHMLTPGSVGKPFFGIKYSLEGDSMLFVSQPWPGMMQTIYNNFDRMINDYFKELQHGYKSGDGAYREMDSLFIAGRLDDVIKVSGHRLGTEELESALVAHEYVAEAAVVGGPDDLTGECIVLFLTPSKNAVINEDINTVIKTYLRHSIGPLATPKKIFWVEGLPKTRSGKIMRRLLKKIILGESDNLGDTSSLANPEVLKSIIDLYTKNYFYG